MSNNEASEAHPVDADEMIALRAENKKLIERVRELEAERDAYRIKVMRLEAKVRAGDALAQSVSAHVINGYIDTRSAPADALLDYRNPPVDEQTDFYARQEHKIQELAKERDALKETLGKAIASIKYIKIHTCPDGWSALPLQRVNELHHALAVDIPATCDEFLSDPTASSFAAEYRALVEVAEKAKAVFLAADRGCEIPPTVIDLLDALAQLDAVEAGE